LDGLAIFFLGAVKKEGAGVAADFGMQERRV
jgi:hypothetical protein